MWCLGLDRIRREVHLTARVEVTAGIVGEFGTNYPSKDGRRIDIIGKISVNDSVQLLGLSDQAWGSGLTFIFNLLDHVEGTGWKVPTIPIINGEGGSTNLT